MGKRLQLVVGWLMMHVLPLPVLRACLNILSPIPKERITPATEDEMKRDKELIKLLAGIEAESGRHVAGFAQILTEHKLGRRLPRQSSDQLPDYHKRVFLFFRRKVPAVEFASMLGTSVANLFSPETLKNAIKEAGIPQSDESSRIHSLREWVVFGLYAAATGIRAACKRDVKLYAAIMEAVVPKLHTRLAECGVGPDDLGGLGNDIRDRFAEYDAAMQNFVGAGPMWHLGKAVAQHISPPTDFPEEMVLSLQAAKLLVKYGDCYRRLFRKFRVVP
jgi:hypothetical protein